MIGESTMVVELSQLTIQRVCRDALGNWLFACETPDSLMCDDGPTSLAAFAVAGGMTLCDAIALLGQRPAMETAVAQSIGTGSRRRPITDASRCRMVGRTGKRRYTATWPSSDAGNKPAV
jgi:hypothetical protein